MKAFQKKYQQIDNVSLNEYPGHFKLPEYMFLEKVMMTWANRWHGVPN